MQSNPAKPMPLGTAKTTDRGGHPAPLRILSGGAANGLVSMIQKTFEAQASQQVIGDYGAVGVMRDRILAGEPVDLVILTRALIRELAESGHVDRSSIRDIGEVVTGVSVIHGQPIPTVSTIDALRQTLLQAEALYVPDTVQSTAGRHIAKVLDALGLTETFKTRLREYPNGQTAMAAMVREGSAASIGCTQITEILNTPGVDYAGDLPAEHSLSTTYTAAVSATAASATNAFALIDMLTAPQNANERRESGFS